MIRQLLIFVFLSLVGNLFAQSLTAKKDSLLLLAEHAESDSVKVDLLLQLASISEYSDPTQAAKFAEQALHLSKHTAYPGLISRAYLRVSVAHYYKGSPSDTLLYYIQSYEQHSLASNSKEELLRVYWMYAIHYSNLGQTDKELEYFLKTLEITRKLDEEPDTETGILSNIGLILFEQKRYAEAQKYFEEGLEIVEGAGLKADLLYNMGLVSEAQENREKALDFFQNAYDLYAQVPDPGKMAQALMKKAQCHEKDKQFELAEDLHFQALSLLKTHDVGISLTEILTALAQHFLIRKKYPEAIKYGEQSIAKIQEQKKYKFLPQTLDLLQESYASVGDYEKAYAFRSEQMQYKDSLKNAEFLTKVEALQNKFSLEQKETENELLKAEAAANKKTIQSKNITALALLLGLLLIGSWALVVLNSNRQKRKYYKTLEATVAERTKELQIANKNLQQANYELQTFNYIASHDIKEPIRNIGNYSGLIFKKLPDSLQDTLGDYFNTINRSTSQLYTLAEDFSQYTQMSRSEKIELQSVNLNDVIENVETGLGSFIKEKNGSIINEKLPVVQTSSSLIYAILKNLIENGLKFNRSASPQVIVSAEVHPDRTDILIKDNGIGIESKYQERVFEMFKRLHHRQEYEGSGIGLAIVKLLVEKIGGKIRLESEVGVGSLFILQIPD